MVKINSRICYRSLSYYFIFAILENSLALGFYIQLEEGDVFDTSGLEGSPDTAQKYISMKDLFSSRSPKLLPVALVSGAIRVIPTIADSLTVYQAAADTLNYVKCKFGTCSEQNQTSVTVTSDTGESTTTDIIEVREPMNFPIVEVAAPSDEEYHPPLTASPVVSSATPVPIPATTVAAASPEPRGPEEETISSTLPIKLKPNPDHIENILQNLNP